MPPNVQRALAQGATKHGSLQDIEHVVLLMQENRSFDHYFGTLSGVRGFGDPHAARLPNGKPGAPQGRRQERPVRDGLPPRADLPFQFAPAEAFTPGRRTRSGCRRQASAGRCTSRATVDRGRLGVQRELRPHVDAPVPGEVTGVAEPNISQWCRSTFGDMTSAFRFNDHKSQPPVLPDTSGPLTLSQEPGGRPRVPRHP
jgi:phospholipase C